MAGNKKQREKLEKLFGAQCFIEKLGLRRGKDIKKKTIKRPKVGQPPMKLTFHHIMQDTIGGKASVENGALLSEENHEWFHSCSQYEQMEMDEKFQEHKKNVLRRKGLLDIENPDSYKEEDFIVPTKEDMFMADQRIPKKYRKRLTKEERKNMSDEERKEEALEIKRTRIENRRAYEEKIKRKEQEKKLKKDKKDMIKKEDRNANNKEINGLVKMSAKGVRKLTTLLMSSITNLGISIPKIIKNHEIVNEQNKKIESIEYKTEQKSNSTNNMNQQEERSETEKSKEEFEKLLKHEPKVTDKKRECNQIETKKVKYEITKYLEDNQKLSSNKKIDMDRDD